MRRKLMCVLLSLCLTLTLFPAAALAVDAGTSAGTGTQNWQISKSKTASPTELTPSSTVTRVTLSLPSAEAAKQDKARIVLVMDKSSVGDIGTEKFTAAASAFIDQLAAKGDVNDVMLDIIVFNWNVTEQTDGFTALNTSTASTLKSKIADVNGSGTNLFGALEYAQWRLTNSADPNLNGVDNSQKYLILISDLGGYLFSSPVADGAADASAVLGGINDSRTYRHQNGAGGNNMDWYGKSTLTKADGSLAYGGLTTSPANITVSASEIDSLIRSKTLLTGDTAADKWLDFSNPAILPATDEEKSDKTYANSYEANVYFNGNILLNLKNAGIHVDTVTRDYHSNQNVTVFEGAFADWMGNNLDLHYDLNGENTIGQAFDEIAGSMVYLLGSGTVTDKIGSNFDLVSSGSACPFTMTLAGEALTASAGSAANTWNFGTADSTGKYPYSVAYTPGSDEQFTWTINVPVEKSKQVTLSYDLKLTVVPSVTTTYPTNQSATLSYTSSDGSQSGREDFAVPTVTVKVTQTPVTPGTTTSTGTGTQSFFRDDHIAYVIGYRGDLVKPNGNITRAEVATIFFRLLSDEVRKANLATSSAFPDVDSGKWYNTAVSTLSKMGIVVGRTDGRFHGADKITRAEFAAIAARFDSAQYSGSDKFTDISGSWARSLINRAAEHGWVVGYGDGTFRPNQPITRAESMTLINRVLDRLPETTDDLLSSMVTWKDNSDTSAWYYLAVQEATNSHEYTQKSNKLYEKWTKLNTVPDWTVYEK